MPKPASEAPGRHRCDTCGKIFSTNSHLRRHEALHTGRSTVVCPVCNRRFSRLDTARRHVKACSPAGADTLLAVPESRRGKARQACDICAKRKLSCDAAFPCTRCVSSKAICTYQRRNLSTPLSISASVVDASIGDSGLSPAPAPAGSVRTASDTSRGKVPIHFMLAFTAPAEHEATRTLVTASRNQSVGQAVSAPLVSPSAFEYNFECYGALFWDQENWTADFIDYSNQDFLGDAEQRARPSTQSRIDTALVNRLAHLCLQLASAHSLLLTNNPNSLVEFDKRLADQVFTTTNLENSVQAYFRQLHRYYPILHRPTFNCETVSLPLLLAIFLFGSLGCAPTDSTLSARKFFDVAEEYIFDYPTMQQLHHGYTNWVISEDQIEVLQAALIIEIVQNGTNNVGTRRRLRARRHPRYIAAVRSCGLFQAAGEVWEQTLDSGQSKWKSFVSKEVRKRLAVWAFVTDSCFASMFNSCPLVAIAELKVESLCCDDVFEAETAAEYEMIELPESSHQTVLEFTKDLLRDTWIDDTRKPPTAMHLMVTICALQSLTMTSRYSCLLQETEGAILRAADRWEDLWHTVTEENRPEAPPLQGFVRHSEELSWFVRKLVQAGNLEVPDCRYTQVEPTDNIQDLHDFLCKYKMT